jgi:hypothetical protein
LPDVCQYEGKKKPAGIKLQYFCQYGDRKKKQPKNKVKHIYFRHYNLLPGIVHFISGVTHMENDLLFCSKLMFTNENIVVCKYIISFYSNLYFCQTHIWTSLLFIYLYQVLHMENDLLFCSILK